MEIINITPVQRDLLTKLKAGNSKLRLSWDESRGALSSARAEDFTSTQERAPVDPETDQRSRLMTFLDDAATLFGLTDDSWREQPPSTRRDNLGFVHHQIQQFARPEGREEEPRSIEVYGARLTAHFKPDGNLVEVQSSFYPDVRPANVVKTTASAVRAKARELVESLRGFADLEARMREAHLFPLMQEPRLVIYPWQGKLIYAWATHGYGPLREGEQGESAIEFGQMFFDAESGDLFLFAPTRSGAENPTVGNGLSCIPLGGPFANRALNVVRIDATPTFRLKDTTRARPIITYDAGADPAFAFPHDQIDNGTIPVSTDTSGAATWNVIAASTSDADRTASQQPEVDGHATCGEIYDWYHAIGGRVGWDDNSFADANRVPPQAINFVAHLVDGNRQVPTARLANALFDHVFVNGHWVSYMGFFDGDPTGSTEPGIVYDYVAGSKAIIAHEYQHGVTNFSVQNFGNPGLTNSGWGGAVHEGLSDVFAGLFSGDWWMGGEISPNGRLWRNLAFPRDPAPLSASKADHWEDRDALPPLDHGYFRGCILAHAAYLMAEGGVHHRSSRAPVLIPVRGLGREIAGGQSVYKAALFWYRTVVDSLPTIGAVTGTPAVDESMFRHLCDGCESAVIDLYQEDTVEHKTVLLAWYAVGLQPVGTTYGADVTFLTWGVDWRMSRPYIGISCPDWSSPDLFINNGGVSEWNALINVMDGGGAPTQFENNVYVRVRNVGDQQANDVVVQFEYAKITAGNAVWQPMVDKNGTVQTLNIGVLGAGQSNFPDGAQNAPPPAACVKWWISPLQPGEVVDHFCIRARVASSNDVNEFNNEVQSNIAYADYTPSAHLRFLVGNSRTEAMPVELAISHTLPDDWKLSFLDPIDTLVLEPKETRLLEATLEMPKLEPPRLTAPFDGRVVGSVDSSVSAKFTGTLHRSRIEKAHLVGEVAFNLDTGAQLNGCFRGRIDVGSAIFDGEVKGVIQPLEAGASAEVKVHVSGWLRPDRVINIVRREEGKPIGGVSFQIQVPLPKGTPFGDLAPTGTTIDPAEIPVG